jgi:hypothetical protein
MVFFAPKWRREDMAETTENIPQTRLFWVLVTIFGGIFTTGVTMVVLSPWWGTLYIVIGLLGFGVLVRDRVRAVPVRMPLLILASVMSSLFIGYLSYHLMELNRKIDIYVMPRKVSEEQVASLKTFLAGHEAQSVTIKVNPQDREATEYWGQISTALRGTSWRVEQNTSTGEPFTLNDGLCIHEQGSNSKPGGLKHDPHKVLQDAFAAAKIQVNCGSGTGAGEYKLYLLVGHRPLMIGWQPPWLFRLGSWLQSMS